MSHSRGDAKRDRRLAHGAIVVLDDELYCARAIKKTLRDRLFMGSCFDVLTFQTIEQMSRALLPERPPDWPEQRKGKPCGRQPLCGAIFDHRLNRSGSVTARDACHRFLDRFYPGIPLIVYSGFFEEDIANDWGSRHTLFVDKLDLVRPELLRCAVERVFLPFDERRLRLREFLIERAHRLTPERVPEYLLRTIEAALIEDVPRSTLAKARGLSDLTEIQYRRSIRRMFGVADIDELRFVFRKVDIGRGTAHLAASLELAGLTRPARPSAHSTASAHRRREPRRVISDVFPAAGTAPSNEPEQAGASGENRPRRPSARRVHR